MHPYEQGHALYPRNPLILSQNIFVFDERFRVLRRFEITQGTRMSAITTEQAREALCRVDFFEHIASKEWVEDKDRVALDYLMAKGWVETFPQYRLTAEGRAALKP